MRYGIWSVILPIEVGVEFTLRYPEGTQILSMHMEDDAIGPWLYLCGDMDGSPLEDHRFILQAIGDTTMYKPWKWTYIGTVRTKSYLLFLFEY